MTDVFPINPDQSDRYGGYVRRGRFDPCSDDNQAAELAWYAWQQGTGPVMTPPYVSRHERVITVSLGTGEGLLTARIDVVMPQPGHLRHLRSDEDRGWWRDWQTAAFGGYYGDDPMDDYEPPSEPDFGREEYERYWALSPLGRAWWRVSSFTWRFAWRWRIKVRWLLLRGRATTSDEPPF